MVINHLQVLGWSSRAMEDEFRLQTCHFSVPWLLEKEYSPARLTAGFTWKYPLNREKEKHRPFCHPFWGSMLIFSVLNVNNLMESSSASLHLHRWALSHRLWVLDCFFQQHWYLKIWSPPLIPYEENLPKNLPLTPWTPKKSHGF